MLKRNRLMCLVLPMFFTVPNTLTPFQNQAMQITENKIDLNGMVHINKMGLIEQPIKRQIENDKIELEKKKTEEQKQKELKRLEEERIKKEQQEKEESNKEWKTFVLTFYTSLDSENYQGCQGRTCTGGRLYEGLVASNYYKLGTKINLQGFGAVTVGDHGSSNFSNDYRLDVYISRNQGENDRQYYNRVNNMGTLKLQGYIAK